MSGGKVKLGKRVLSSSQKQPHIGCKCKHACPSSANLPLFKFPISLSISFCLRNVTAHFLFTKYFPCQFWKPKNKCGKVYQGLLHEPNHYQELNPRKGSMRRNCFSINWMCVPFKNEYYPAFSFVICIERLCEWLRAECRGSEKRTECNTQMDFSSFTAMRLRIPF